VGVAMAAKETRSLKMQQQQPHFHESAAGA